MRTDFIEAVPAPSKTWMWSDNKLERLKDIKTVMDRLKPFWPLGVRTVYYQVISLHGFRDSDHWKSQGPRNFGAPIKNVIGTVGELVKQARLKKNSIYLDRLGLYIPMWAINDDGRKISGKVGFSSTREFLDQQIEGVFNGYSACLAQTQERHIEVWIEKQGLYHIVEPVVKKFCRQTLAVRGYPSVTCLNEYAGRIESLKNQRTLILYFGDMDIDGVAIPETTLTSLIEEHEIDAKIVRCGLNPNHINDIHADPVGLKGSKEEKARFRQEYGNEAYELDAIDPPDLQDLVYDSLAAFTDMEVLELEKKAGEKDRKKFDNLQFYVEDYAREMAAADGLIVS